MRDYCTVEFKNFWDRKGHKNGARGLSRKGQNQTSFLTLHNDIEETCAKLSLYPEVGNS